MFFVLFGLVILVWVCLCCLVCFGSFNVFGLFDFFLAGWLFLKSYVAFDFCFLLHLFLFCSFVC